MEKILQILGTITAFFTMLFQAPVILFTDNPPTREQLEAARIHEESKQKLLEKKQKELKIGAAETEKTPRQKERATEGVEESTKPPRVKKPKEETTPADAPA